MKGAHPWRARAVALAALTAAVCRAAPAADAAGASPSLEEVFANPPPQAHVGVWWHWMGRQVTEAGIVRDLDWMASRGVTSATIFGLADATVPWAKRIANVPTDIGQPYSDAWWKCTASRLILSHSSPRFAQSQGCVNAPMGTCPTGTPRTVPSGT